MRITYEEKEKIFLTSFRRTFTGTSSGREYLNKANNDKLQEFFHMLSYILEEGSKITFGKSFCTIVRKKLTGEVLCCSSPYTVCLGFWEEPYKFIDLFL